MSPFIVSEAPILTLKIVKNALSKILGVTIYVTDIIITAHTLKMNMKWEKQLFKFSKNRTLKK